MTPDQRKLTEEIINIANRAYHSGQRHVLQLLSEALEDYPLAAQQSTLYKAFRAHIELLRAEVWEMENDPRNTHRVLASVEFLDPELKGTVQ